MPIDPQPIAVEIHLFGSTNIDTVAYDEETRDLRVHFVSGLTYIYEDVPARVVFGLLASQSRGAYFAEHIRMEYAYRLLDKDVPDGWTMTVKQTYDIWPEHKAEQSGPDDGDDVAAPAD